MGNMNHNVAEEIDLLNVISLRSSIYSFLSRGFSGEIDMEYLGLIRSYLPMLGELSGKTENPVYKKGLERLSVFMDGITDDKALTEDYARKFVSLFLNMSDDPLQNINPFESVYLSPERLVMQEPRDQVVEFYAEYGHGINEDFNEPEDHIAAELGFLSSLNSETAKDISSGKKLADIVRNLEGHLEFMKKHLLRWLPALNGDLNRTDPEGLYGILSEVTLGFSLIDVSFLEELLGYLKKEF